MFSSFRCCWRLSKSREEAGESPPLPQLQEPEKYALKELRPLKGALSAICIYGCMLLGFRVIEEKLVYMYNKRLNVGRDCGAAVKCSGNTTNSTAHVVKWREGMKIEMLTKPCTAKQAFLGGVGIRVVSCPLKAIISSITVIS